MPGYSKANLNALIRNRTDTTDDTDWLPDAELDDLAAQSIEQLWEHLYTIFGGTFKWIEESLSVTSATGSGPYTLAVAPNKVWRIRRMDIDFYGVRQPLRPWNPSAGAFRTTAQNWISGDQVFYDLNWTAESNPTVYFYPIPAQNYTVTYQFVPQPPVPDDSGVNSPGYDEWTVCDVGQKIALKKGHENEAALWGQRRDQYLERIKRDAPPRDPGHPQVIADHLGRGALELGLFEFHNSRYGS